MINYKECIEESDLNVKRLLITPYGEVKVEHINTIRDLLLESFTTQDHIVLDVAEVTDSDFAFYQLLCATNKYAQTNKKHFALRNHLKSPFREQAETLGFLRQHGCAEAEDPAQCLWLTANH